MTSKTQRWEMIAEGYYTTIKTKTFAATILLRVGRGIPGCGFDGVQGVADISLNGKAGTVPERLLIADNGHVEGEFNDLVGNVGESWDIGNIKLIDPTTLDDGDERNDDNMKAFLIKYLRRLDYVDELKAAKEEGFCGGVS